MCSSIKMTANGHVFNLFSTRLSKPVVSTAGNRNWWKSENIRIKHLALVYLSSNSKHSTVLSLMIKFAVKVLHVDTVKRSVMVR